MEGISFEQSLANWCSTGIQYLRKKSKVEIYTYRVRIFFVGSEAELSRLCLFVCLFVLSGKEIAITLQLILARDAVRF